MPSRRQFFGLTVLLLVVSAGIYLVGNASVQLWDRDEPRYAQCSREMLMGSPEHPGSDFVVPRFLGEPRYAKPPAIYWLQAGAMNVMGDTAFAARFPSTVSMLVVLAIVVVAVLRATADRERALWMAFILATSVLTLAAAKSSLTDATLLIFVTIAQICVYAIWRGNRSWGTFAALGAACGVAGLVKGPVVFGMIGATLVALSAMRGIEWWLGRRGKGKVAPVSGLPVSTVAEAETPKMTRSVVATMLKVVLALLILAAIAFPWIYLIEQRSPGFLKTSIGINVIDRIRKGSEGHSAPPGYYLATIWGTYFPWCIFIPMAFVFAWQRRRIPMLRYSLAAVVGPFVMLECVQTKLPHYLLPAFPFLAFLTADALVRCFREQHDDLTRKSFVGVMRVWAIVVALFGSAPWLMTLKFREQPWFALALTSLVTIAYGITVFALFKRRRLRSAVAAMGVGFMVVVVTMYGFFLPRADYMRLSIKVADLLKAHGVTGADQVVMQDYKEPSLGFYQGGTIRERSSMKIVPEELPPWLVTTRNVFTRAPDDVKSRFTEIGSVHGLAIADGGRSVEVVVLQKR